MDKKKTKAVVCLSGGMDSLCALAIAIEDHDEVILLHVNYGQRTEAKELETFKAIGRWYNIPEDRMIVVETNIFKIIGSSCLTDETIEVPENKLGGSEIPVSYVPFRNGNILSMAVALAEAKEAEAVYTGFVEQDSSGYPDCTEIFVKSFNEVVKRGTLPKTKIDIICPCILLMKNDVVRFSIQLKAPLHLSWSCYQNEEKACGICDSCALRINGFMKEGYIDPIPYKVAVNWKNCKPYTAQEVKSDHGDKQPN